MTSVLGFACAQRSLPCFAEQPSRLRSRGAGRCSLSEDEFEEDRKTIGFDVAKDPKPGPRARYHPVNPRHPWKALSSLASEAVSIGMDDLDPTTELGPGLRRRLRASWWDDTCQTKRYDSGSRTLMRTPYCRDLRTCNLPSIMFWEWNARMCLITRLSRFSIG